MVFSFSFPIHSFLQNLFSGSFSISWSLCWHVTLDTLKFMKRISCHSHFSIAVHAFRSLNCGVDREKDLFLPPTMFRDVRLSSCNYSARAFKDEWKFMSGDNQRDRTKKLKACTSKLLMPTQLNHQLFYHMLLSIRWYPWWLVDWLASSSVSSSSSSSLIWTIGLYLTICQAQQPVTAMEELLTNCAWQGFKGELGSQLLKVGELESDDSRMQRLLSFLPGRPNEKRWSSLRYDAKLAARHKFLLEREFSQNWVKLRDLESSLGSLTESSSKSVWTMVEMELL